MNEKDAYIEHLENTIKDLQDQVSSLTEVILLLRKEKFGSKSEKTPQWMVGCLCSTEQKSRLIQMPKNPSSDEKSVSMRKIPKHLVKNY